ncbi:MAG: hypothetical protein ACFFBP_10440 [Promethearchaeota archaeon]
MEDTNFDEIIQQLKSELKTECAIANKYGIVLGSAIKEFSKGKIVPNNILEFINNSNEIANELNLQHIDYFTLASQKHNYLFTFSKKLILISKLDLSINMAKFMPGVNVFLNNLEQKVIEKELDAFTTFDFSQDIEKIKETLKEDEDKEKKYSIIKDLIKYISN